MNEQIILAFTIILSFVGIVVSIAGLTISIIYIIKLSYLAQKQKEINEAINKIEIIKKALIYDCCLFDKNGLINGEQVIKEICQKYSCDEWTAISIYKSNCEENLE